MSELTDVYADAKPIKRPALQSCVSSHRNPTRIMNYVLPLESMGNLQMDPRPSTRICTSYYNTSAGDAPILDETPYNIVDSLLNNKGTNVIPNGGSARLGFPYENYSESVTSESELMGLYYGLTKCKEMKYVPISLPAQTNHISGIQSLDLPFGSTEGLGFVCRQEDDAAAEKRSSKFFMNATRNDRM